MTKADELWEKYQSYRTAESAMSKLAFTAALHEYGAAVRARDAEIAKNYLPNGGHGDSIGIYVVAAIKKEPLP